jgi:hypothetical protein
VTAAHRADWFVGTVVEGTFGDGGPDQFDDGRGWEIMITRDPLT